MKSKTLGLLCSWVLISSFCVTVNANNQDIKAMQQLLAAKQYLQAYELGLSLADQLEGTPKYDFAFGLAAIETQHFDHALFAFERLLLQFPFEPRYRLEFARTHFYLRNLERAETEFRQVLTQHPPEPVEKNVHRFLDQIALLKRAVEPTLVLSLDTGGGYDSNINSATADKELPKEELIFPVDIELSDDSRETASAYWNALASVYYAYPLTKRSHVDGRFLVSKRENSETPTYNLDTAMADAAYAVNTGPFRWRAGGRYQHVLLDGSHLLDSQAALGQVQWFLLNDYNITLGGTYGETLYPDNANANLQQQQYNLTFASPENWSLSFLYGDDTAMRKAGKYNGKQYQGLDYRAFSLISPRSTLLWGLNMINSQHKAVNELLFTKRRKELATTLSGGWRYQILSRLALRSDASYSYTDSSLKANTFQRIKLEFGLTYSY